MDPVLAPEPFCLELQFRLAPVPVRADQQQPEPVRRQTGERFDQEIKPLDVHIQPAQEAQDAGVVRYSVIAPRCNGRSSQIPKIYQVPLDQYVPVKGREEILRPLCCELCERMQPSRPQWAAIHQVQVNDLLEPAPRRLEAQLAVRRQHVRYASPAQVLQQRSEPAIHGMQVKEGRFGPKLEPFGEGRPAQIPERANLGVRKLASQFRQLRLRLRRDPYGIESRGSLAGDEAPDGGWMAPWHL